MPTWDMEETRSLVRRNAGSAQFDLARQSLSSTIDRLEHARLHYHDLKDMIEKSIRPLHTDKKLFLAMVGSAGDERQREYEKAIFAVGAHAIACVQSLHSISDIFAHAIYYSLGLNLQPKALKERDITVNFVQRLLRGLSEYKDLANGLNSLISHEHYEYLMALSNQSKHRSLVKTVLWIDMQSEEEPFQFKFQDFAYAGKAYMGVEFLPYLKACFNRISEIVIDTGIELNRVLRHHPSA